MFSSPVFSVARQRTALAVLVSLATGALVLQRFPGLELELFARTAAGGASLLTGSPVVRVEEGWMLAGLQPRLVVSTACSATDYFLITTALFAWQLARRGLRWPLVAGSALVAALPVACGVNALRIVFVGQVHRWVIPLFPDAYGAFLHLLAGVAVFLPALIALNLAFEFHGNTLRRRRP